ncbi:hypothetical protein [Dactylosporangium sp. NPDC049140]|uniref:hypothetical protein n=1 Tax=Dactylosporangium sp. NPDC049140 TaxID=3155647 RepID=UPI0033E91A5C
MARTNPTGEPRLGAFASWAVLTASFILSASTWIAFATLAGFTDTLTVHGVTLRLAWLMPIVVDGYVVVALVLWTAPVPAKVAAFARKNTYFAVAVGVTVQSAYHLLTVWSLTHVVWQTVLAAIGGMFPPAVSGLAVHMRALLRRESSIDAAVRQPSDTHTSPVQVPPGPALEPVRVPAPKPIPVPVPAIPAAVEAWQPAAAPAPSFRLSTLDDVPAEPAPVAGPAPAAAVPPTPADLKARIVSKPAPAPTASAAAPVRPARPSRPVPAGPAMTAAPLAPPATDSVARPGAAQLALPIVSPDLLERAREIAEQYRTEHGTPITAGQLAVQLRKSTQLAAQALAALGETAAAPARPINGRRVPASR